MKRLTTARSSDVAVVDSEQRYDVLLGGADLEMQTIKAYATRMIGAEHVHDAGLKWGAHASSYDAMIRDLLARGRTPVLVELVYDLAADIARDRLVEIDHHGAAAGQDKPSALRQIVELLSWARWHRLVEANDIGHIAGLVRMGATREEIAEVRAADRRAQGITFEIEMASRHAIEARKVEGRLTLIETDLPTASAITDFLAPELGGPGAENLLVVMAGKLAFYGDGAIIAALADVHGCWYGGALPKRGYWGVMIDDAAKGALVERIVGLAR